VADKTTTLVFIAKDSASKAIKDIDKSLDGLHTSAGKVGSGLATVGKAMGALAIGGGIALGGVIAYATKKAAEEEVGIKKLDAALKANDKAWDGNRKAIEAAINAGEKKAFSDDQIRDSLSALIVNTKDLTKATELSAVAQDFARLRGIDLTTASTIVGKVYGGNIGILARYGIQLEKGASKTEALAAIQAAAAGQADAYAGTTQGAFERWNVAMDNLTEDLGRTFLPIATSIANFLVDNIIPAIREVGAAISTWIADNRELIESVGAFLSGALTGFVSFLTGTLIPVITSVAGTLASIFGPAIEFLVSLFGGLGDKAGAGLSGLGDQLAAFGTSMLEAIAGWIGTVIPMLAELAGKFIDWIAPLIPPLLVELGKYALRLIGWIGEQIPVLAAQLVKWGGELIAWIAPRLPGLIAKLGEMLYALGTWLLNVGLPELVRKLVEWGEALVAWIAPMIPVAIVELGKWLAGLGEWVITKALPAFLGWALDMGEQIVEGIIGGLADLPAQLIEEIGKAIAGIRIDIGPFHLSSSGFSIDMPNISLPSIPGLAAGGPVYPGRTYLVGEQGPEWFTPATSGHVIPNAATVAGGDSGAPVVIQLQVDGRTLAEVVDRQLFYKYRLATS